MDAEGVQYNSRGQRPRKDDEKMIVTVKGSYSAKEVRPFQGREILPVDPGAPLRSAPGYYLSAFQAEWIAVAA